ncbi:hypothetical protein Tco_1538480 [Tanacetum coccineum]
MHTGVWAESRIYIGPSTWLGVSPIPVIHRKVAKRLDVLTTEDKKRKQSATVIYRPNQGSYEKGENHVSLGFTFLRPILTLISPLTRNVAGDLLHISRDLAQERHFVRYLRIRINLVGGRRIEVEQSRNRSGVKDAALGHLNRSPAHLAVVRNDHTALRNIISDLPRLAKVGDVITGDESVFSFPRNPWAVFQSV